jgi:nucleoside 2-deoxyribosyltransferase
MADGDKNVAAKEDSAVPVILSVFLAITIKSTFDHALEDIGRYPNFHAIWEGIQGNYAKALLLVFQALIFLITLGRFYWGAYRYGQVEAGKPKSFRRIIFDLTGLFLLFAGFYVTSMVVAHITLFYWAVASFHLIDLILFYPLVVRGSTIPELQSVLKKWCLFDAVTSTLIILFMIIPFPGFWSQWAALLTLLGVGLWDVIGLRHFYVEESTAVSKNTTRSIVVIFLVLLLGFAGGGFYSMTHHGTTTANKELAKKCQVYMAGPYGFAESTKGFMKEKFYPSITKTGCLILDPWRHELSPRPMFAELMSLGKKNAQDIDLADGVVAALDGPDVDSGTAAEIGYAAARGKWIIGYRGDLRSTGDNREVKVNLQVQYFIVMTGGEIVTTIEELTKAVTARMPK